LTAEPKTGNFDDDFLKSLRVDPDTYQRPPDRKENIKPVFRSLVTEPRPADMPEVEEPSVPTLNLGRDADLNCGHTNAKMRFNDPKYDKDRVFHGLLMTLAYTKKQYFDPAGVMIHSKLVRRDADEFAKLLQEYDIPHPDVIPKMANRLYGCMRCEWIHSVLCPHMQKNMPMGGICRKRKLWLAFIAGDVKTEDGLRVMQFSAWHERFLKNRLIMESTDDLTRAHELLAKFKEAERLGQDDKIRLYEELRTAAKGEWSDAVKTVLKHETMQLERETAKKVDVTNRMFSVQDIQNIIKDADNDKIVDAQYEVLPEDAKKKEATENAS
jgi:hypothetical protein